MFSVSTPPQVTARPDRSRGTPPNPLEPLVRLFRDLSSSADGLSVREAARRLEVYGPNELTRRVGRRWPGELARQFTHPLALLLLLAAVLAWVSGTPRPGVVIAAVILLNAGFAFAQEMQAERAVEALAAFLPEQARVLRDGDRSTSVICTDKTGTLTQNRMHVTAVWTSQGAAALVYLPVMHGFFGTEGLSPVQLAIVVPFPFIVWGADEIRRLVLRRYHASRQGLRPGEAGL